MAFQITNPRKFFGLLLIAIIIVGTGIWMVAWGSGDITKSGEFVIEQGSSSRKVWTDVVAKGFSNRSLPWKYYSWREGAAGKIQAGTYQLTRGEHIKDVVRRFTGGDTLQNELTITFPEGFTLEQIAQRTAAQGIGSADDFMEAASHPEKFAEEFPFLSGLPDGRTLEGYLFPDTYRVFPDDTPEDVIKRMLAAFQQKVLAAGIPDKAKEHNRTLDQVVIMASIVEREVRSDDDMALVAGILWARFDDQVGLGADATVRYVLRKPTAALTTDDLAADSPYNTRKFKGLPPGPISSPGSRALSAAADPQSSDYYYYLTAQDGKTVFSKTLEEHNMNKLKYL